MKIDKIALAFFVVFSIMASLSSAMDWNGILLFCKPLIIPALAFYYLGNTQKVSRSVALFLIVCFVGDAIALFNFEQEILYLLAPFFIGNLIIVRLALRESKRFYWDTINAISLALVLFILGIFMGYRCELFLGGKGITSVCHCHFRTNVGSDEWTNSLQRTVHNAVVKFVFVDYFRFHFGFTSVLCVIYHKN